MKGICNEKWKSGSRWKIDEMEGKKYTKVMFCIEFVSFPSQPPSNTLTQVLGESDFILCGN